MTITAIAFDMDGTLTPAKDHPSDKMAKLFVQLLKKYRVAIISGASFEQFQGKFLNHLNLDSDLASRLLLLPTTGSVIYEYRNTWSVLEEHFLSEGERKNIIEVLTQCMDEFKVKRLPDVTRQIDDRKSQVTFSGCGQNASESERATFDPHRALRLKMAEYMRPKLPYFEVCVAGSTSIDITRKDLNKASAMRRIVELWDLRRTEIVFIGDAMTETGNDYSVLMAGFLTKYVKNHLETESWLSNLVCNLQNHEISRS